MSERGLPVPARLSNFPSSIAVRMRFSATSSVTRAEKRPLAFMAKLCQTLEPTGMFETLPDLGHDLVQRLEVGGADVGRQLREERLGSHAVDAHQGEDVRLVEGRSGHVPLAVERGKGVELEEDEALGSGAGNLPLHETPPGGVAPADLVEERIADQQEVDLEPREVGAGEIVLPAYHLQLGQALQGRQGHDQVDVLGVAPFDILEKGDAAHQQVVDPP